MRPIKMRLTAFGPFPDTQTVDFRPALGARLFGIYGPTGAGKTSILDGICFALFGESSGQERQGDADTLAYPCPVNSLTPVAQFQLIHSHAG